jgi:hypothetical protein
MQGLSPNSAQSPDPDERDAVPRRLLHRRQLVRQQFIDDKADASFESDIDEDAVGVEEDVVCQRFLTIGLHTGQHRLHRPHRCQRTFQ